MKRLVAILLHLSLCLAFASAPANRFTHLDEDDPFYPNLDFPRLTTPQWIGEPGVEAVVILAIDDMRDPPKYEKFFRPILDRLKKIDGHAPLSIMVNSISPDDPQLQSWLKEGLSLDVHTIAHPCPLLAKGNFNAAAETYHTCVDLLNQIPGNKPVAFRMPCCDSMNSPSPRFYAEIFNQTSPKGHFLTLDSSVMNIFTGEDPALSDLEIANRFAKYLPAQTNEITRVTMKSFVTTIKNYPYPYVIGRLCWQFPAMVPSDWEAHNLHGSTNATTLADWKVALDATVLKQGTFTYIFHPHGWSSAAQMVDFIDYAVAKYGKKVKFLNFAEAQTRLDKFLLAGQALRDRQGAHNGVRLMDLNGDGYQDVIIGNAAVRKTRVWNPEGKSWNDTDFPASVAHVKLGLIDETPIMVVSDSTVRNAWRFENGAWREDKSLLNGFRLGGELLRTSDGERDRGVRFRDVNRDGSTELIVGNESQNAVFSWSSEEKQWNRLAYALPKDTAIIDADGRDAGLRFVDVNGDGYDDIIFSNGERFSLYQFVSKANERLSWKIGWNDEVLVGKRGDPNEIPPIVRAGSHPNNGVWFKNGTMWIQNEDTAHLPDKVDRRSFHQLLTADDSPAKSPEQSLAAIKVRPGFQVELVASEPLVTDPVAFDWGADGRLWVVEMSDYPLGLGGHGEPGGKVRFLEDTNHDGRYDRATIFLDKLTYPNGIIPWRKGVIVSAAPEIFYAEDTDGDGKADVRRTLFTGFNEGNPQHRCNGFDYGLDHWLYGANGDSGGVITSPANSSNKGISISGQDFRFRPEEGQFEAIEGQTQFGRHRDDWGNWFGNNNPTWLWHYYLPAQYVARNPLLAVRSNKRYLANYPESTRAFPVTRIRQRFNDPHQAGHVTSGNSATPYRDELFGPDFATSVFISEPVHNLIHREVLEPDGVSFRSHRAADERDREFLASADPWFRPTMLRTGPDGALYIADMYRLVLEHPEWITKDILQRLDTRAGDDKGRIYRVSPKNATLRPLPRLDRMNTAELVAALDQPNGWQRDTAQRLLLHAKDQTAIPLLKKLFRSAARPQTRIHILYTLHEFDALNSELIAAALADSNPRVREHAIRLAPNDTDLSRCAKDLDLRVIYQLAFTLGDRSDAGSGDALMQIVAAHADNADIRLAVLSSAMPHANKLLDACAKLTEVSPGAAAFIEQVATFASKRDLRPGLGHLFDSRLPILGKFAAAAGLLEVIDRQRVSVPQPVTALLPEARRLAVNADTPEPLRLAAVKLLGRSAEDAPALAQLFDPHHLPSLQKAALNALAKSETIDAGELLIREWKNLSPALRPEALSALLSRRERIGKVLDGLESGAIPAGEITVAQQNQLLKSASPETRRRVEKIFAARETNRSALLERYSNVKALNGDARKGAALFQQQCATCHRFKGQGTELGPDLGMVANKSVEALLTAILDPNRAVESRYISYNLSARNGDEYSGLITSESANSLTLRSAGGVEKTILRSDIGQISSSGVSLMPEGLETALPPQQMADLITYILSE